MVCKVGEKYDHLEVIREAGINLGEKLVECKCDCGRIVNKNDYTLRQPSLKYKACGHPTCEFSGIKNLDQDLTVFEKKKAKARVNDKTRARKIEVDCSLANQFLLGR